ncbi:MAG: hypothetical protein C4543_06440 [Ignavibacteriales bacterium]|jgi:hypothetical protein|nr:MAG: hypothetical protein C4543_06440 [Ignavibacteriales bacterium]
MKIKILTILFGWLLYSNISAQEECLIKINIHSNRDMIYASINDGEYYFVNSQLALPVGIHKIKFTDSIKEWGSEVIEKEVKINNCDEVLNLTADFDERTLIISSPDADITSNDSIIGYTPIRLPMSFNEVHLSRKNYSSEKISLQNIPEQPRVKLNFLGKEYDEPFIHSTLFKILVGSAVALGATAAYFKIEADNNFDKYTETRQSVYLDNTDKYDLYSGLAFGALQINFGVLLYYFLIE